LGKPCPYRHLRLRRFAFQPVTVIASSELPVVSRTCPTLVAVILVGTGSLAAPSSPRKTEEINQPGVVMQVQGGEIQISLPFESEPAAAKE
jgi:hypothetical protein